MGTFNLTITYPDAAQAEVVAALRAHFASNGVPNPTLAQIRAALEKQAADFVRGLVLAARQKAAADAVVPVDIT